MTEETAKLLAEAMNRLAAAIERVSGTNGLQYGIHIHHHGAPSCSSPSYQNQNYLSSYGGLGGVS